MKWIVNVFAFVMAFILGTLATSLLWGQGGLSDCVVSFTPDQPPVVDHSYPSGPSYDAGLSPTAQNLTGTWNGTWDHDGGDCTIFIDRVDGNRFSGTLKKAGAVVLFKGTFDPMTRYVQFNETKVVQLGTHMTQWSLGKDSGTISYDGRYLSGTGTDKWGEYNWEVSKD